MPNDLNANADLRATMIAMGAAAREASRALARSETGTRNRALEAAAKEMLDREKGLLAANAKDVKAARAEGNDDAFIDRLALTAKAIEAMAEGVREVAKLPDPVGEVTDLRYRPSGIQVGRMRVPLGVIGIIYESRPNVTADAASLCLKSGNASILRGGSEALNSNQAIAACMAVGLKVAGLPETAVQLVSTPDRAAVSELVAMEQYVDAIVPRGGKSLIERVARDARVPVIKHLDGVCHVYIDDRADIEKAVAIAEVFIDKGIEMRVDAGTRRLLGRMNGAILVDAQESDWSEEYLAPIVSIAVVPGLDEAIAHIAKYGSQHTDAIVTEDWSRAQRFLREVDSSSVMVNASTRFADGFEYGLGAEIGISNDKLHARGPVGLEGLTSVKYIVFGHGESRN